MLKQSIYSIVFVLLLINIVIGQDKFAKTVSSDAVQSLVARGFKVLGMQRQVRAPIRDKEDQPPEMENVQIEVSLDLSRTNIQPVYMGRPLQAKTMGQAPYDTILVESFEGEFPGDRWQLSGDPTWGKISGGHSGSSQIWCAAGGDSAINPPSNYLNNMNAMMVFGPFDLSNSTLAFMRFWYKLDTEIEKDWLFWMASVDGNNFSGFGISGSTADIGGLRWERTSLNLASVPELGNLIGSPSVWIAFSFTSDSSGTDRGAYLDDIEVLKGNTGTGISGFISGELTLGESPYIVVDNAGVAREDTLKIEPGVEIRFDKGFFFLAQSTVLAQGTETDSIKFTSNVLEPNAGDWGGILANGTPGAVFEYCIIEYAGFPAAPRGTIRNFGLGISGGPVPIIQNNFFRRNDTAINMLSASDVLIEENSFEHNNVAIRAELSATFVANRNVIRFNRQGISTGPFNQGRVEGNLIEENERSGIAYTASSLVILNNRIINNGGNGIFADGNLATAVANLVARGNFIASNDGFGIHLRTLTADEIIVGNTIVRNGDSAVKVGAAESLGDNLNAVVINNTISENSGHGIDFSDNDPSEATVVNNIIVSNTGIGINAIGLPGLAFNNIYDNAENFSSELDDAIGRFVAVNANGDSADIFFNISEEPLFVDPDNNDYSLQYVENGFSENSPCRDAGNPVALYNDLDGTINDMGFSGGTNLFVNFSDFEFEPIVVGLESSLRLFLWNLRDTTFKITDVQNSNNENFSIQRDVSEIQAFEGKRILTIRFTPQSVGLHETILSITSSDLVGADKFSIKITGEGLSGTILTGGKISGVWRKENSPYIIQGNITVPADTSLRVEPGVEVRFGSTSRELKVSGKLSAIGTQIDTIRFDRGRIVFRDSSSGNSIEFCSFRGSGVELNNSSAMISNCRFFAGLFGAIVCRKSSANIVESVITNAFNADFGAAIYFDDSDGLIVSNIIAKNIGTGVRFRHSSATVINSTITENSGYGISLRDSASVTFLNNILWDNGRMSIEITEENTAEITYSDIQGGWEGEGNIDIDPLFVDAENGDFQLQPNSPAIDAGNPDSQFNDIEDPNNPGFALFPSQGTVRNDMGAFGGPSALGSLVTSVEESPTIESPISFELMQNYPNPFNPETTIKYQIVKNADIKLEIYNILGQRVRILVNEKQTAGVYAVKWDGKDDSGRNVASGIFLYRLETNDFIKVRKLVLVR